MAPVQNASAAALLPRRSAGVYPTLWSNDHGDPARRKFTYDGGLPAALDAAKIELIESRDTPYPQWLYTRAEDELFIYGFPANPGDTPYFAKLDSRSMVVRQKIDLPKTLYLGGALMHCSGDVFLVNGPCLYRFRQGDLSQVQTLQLPKANGVFTQYNGLSVTDDGTLVLKGWSLTAAELELFKGRLRQSAPRLAGVVDGGEALLANNPLARRAAAGLRRLDRLRTALGGAQTEVMEFLAPTETGCLLLVDPDAMKVRQYLVPPERIAFARMAIAPATLAQEMGQAPVTAEYMVTLGETCVHRWRYEHGQLRFDPTWSEPYRKPGDGSFPGTGPAILGQQVFYTDNTFPIGLGKGYRGYRKALGTSTPQDCVQLSPDTPGFMFWSCVTDPVHGVVYTWDTANAWLEARSTENFELRWRRRLFNTDCLITQAQHGHVYATDMDPFMDLTELMRTIGRRPQRSDIRKDFVVLDHADGGERLRVSLGHGGGVSGMLMPGFHRDVFVARRSGLVRVHQRP